MDFLESSTKQVICPGSFDSVRMDDMLHQGDVLTTAK